MLVSTSTKKGLFFFYIFMILWLVSWTNTTTLPPMPLRFAYLGLLFLPTLINESRLFPFVVTTFYTITLYSYTLGFGYMPTMPYMYLVLTVFTLFVQGFKDKYKYKKLKGFRLFVFLSLYMIFIDSFIGAGFRNTQFYLLTVSLFPFFLTDDRKYDSDSLLCSFIIISLVLSIQYLVFRDQYILLNAMGQETDRAFWIDPNYFGCVIGMGVVASLIYLMEPKTHNHITVLTIVSIATIIVSIIALGFNASRGALLATGLAVIVLVLFSKLTAFKKILTVSLLFGLLLFIYKSGVFDVLIMRIQEDDGTGTGRTDIWMRKLTGWIESGNPFYWFFGMSWDGGYHLNTIRSEGAIRAFHNDFLAFLIEYGVFGLVAFIMLLIKPILNTPKRFRHYIAASVVFIATASLTLEPLTNGNWAFYAFLFFIYCRMSYYIQLSDSVRNEIREESLYRKQERA